MKKQIPLYLLIAAIIILGVRYHFLSQQDEIHILQGHRNIVLKQMDGKVKYFVKEDPYSIYNYLKSIKLKKSDSGIIKKWNYMIILTNDLIMDGDGNIVKIPNTTNTTEICKICVYDYMIEINGIVYEPEDSAEVIEWFDNFYESNKNDYNEKIL